MLTDQHREHARPTGVAPDQTGEDLETEMVRLGMDFLGARVPCRGCTACYKGHEVPLLPEWGDDPSMYDHDVIDGGFELKRKPNGDCIYLGKTGCTIHERAPLMCRAFDCRRLWTFATEEQRRALLREFRERAPFWRAVFDAGRARMREG